MTRQVHLVYVVKPEECHWTIGFGSGNNAGRFPSRLEALKSAVRDAVRVRRLGHQVDVLVWRRDGALRMVRHDIRVDSRVGGWTAARERRP